MNMSEEAQHNLLLLIVSLLFILFSTGLATEPEVEAGTVIVT